MKTTFIDKIEVLEELADSVWGHSRSAQFVQVWCHCIQLVDIQWISRIIEISRKPWHVSRQSCFQYRTATWIKGKLLLVPSLLQIWQLKWWWSPPHFGRLPVDIPENPELFHLDRKRSRSWVIGETGLKECPEWWREIQEAGHLPLALLGIFL